MLTSIRLQSFKGHHDTTVRVGRMTLLVGPNGSGKSSVLQAFLLLGSMIEREPQQMLRKRGDLLRRGSEGPVTLTAEGNAGDVPWSLAVAIQAEAREGALRARSPLSVDWTYAGRSVHAADVTIPLRNQSGETPLDEAVGQAVLYRFDAARIGEATWTDEPEPTVEADGRNTATVLAILKLEQEEVFDRIQIELRKIVPSVERIRIRRVPVGSGMGERIHLDLRGAPDIPASEASEGTLITLALLTVLFSPGRPNLVLLDDIDHALHPEAQIELVRQLKRLVVEIPDLQIVATTHSPYILDELDPADVQVFALRKDGSVATKRLSEHPQAAKAAGALTSGQLWSLDPERRWVAEEA